MKKRKLSLGSGGFKGLVIQHVEKLVFGISIVFVFVFIFLGYRLDSKLTGKTPDKLQELAATAVNNIERPTHDNVRKERTPREGQGGQYVARVDIARNPLVATIYQTNKPWNLPAGRPGMKREDPELFPPTKFEISAFTGALCVRSEEEGPLADLENAPADVEKPKRVKAPRRPRGGGSGGSGSMMPGMGGSGSGMMPGMGDGGSMMPGMGSGMGSGSPYGSGTGDTSGRKKDDRKDKDRKAPPARRYPANKVEGYRPTGTASSMPGMGDGGSMMPGMGSGGGMMPGMGSGGGMMPGMGSGGSMIPGSTGRSAVAGKPVGKTQHVIAVRALAPYRKQADEFKRVLGEAIGYDPVRDAPRIVFFQAQRVDVTDDPSKEPAESDWQPIMNPKKAGQMAEDGKWDGFMQEVADPNYVDPNATMPGPPIMLRNMEEVMLHSEVPRSTIVPTVQTLETDEEADTETTPKDDAGADLPGGGIGGGSRAGGYPGMGSGGGMMPGMGSGGSMMPGMGSGGSMMPGMGSGGSMMPGMGSGGSMMPGMGSGGSMMPGMGSGGSMMPGMGSGGSMMPGMGGPGFGMPGSSYGGSYATRAEPAQFKLIRFFDMDVEPGRVYRYRVRLFIEDPNNPNTDPINGFVSMPPRRRTLSLKVIDRLNKQQADAAAKNAYYVTTKWSDPSAPVSLPSTARAYVGEVTPVRTAAGVDGTQVLQSDVSGSVVPVVWNDVRAIDVAKEVKAYRGSVLNTKPPFDILDPVTLVVKLLKDFELNSQYLVVDMRGGDDLPGDRKNKVTSIGEYMLMDDQGNLVVHNELDDYENFRRFTLEDEVKVGGMGGGSFGPGGGSGGGYPGMGGSGGELGPGAPGMGGPGMGAPGMGGPGMGGPGAGMPGGGGGSMPGAAGGGSRRGGGGGRGRR